MIFCLELLLLVSVALCDKKPVVFPKYKADVFHFTKIGSVSEAFFVDEGITPHKALGIEYGKQYNVELYHVDANDTLAYTVISQEYNPCLVCQITDVPYAKVDILMDIRELIQSYLGVTKCYSATNETCDSWSMGSMDGGGEGKSSTWTFYALESNGYPDAAVSPAGDLKFVFSDFAAGPSIFDDEKVFSVPCPAGVCK